MEDNPLYQAIVTTETRDMFREQMDRRSGEEEKKQMLFYGYVIIYRPDLITEWFSKKTQRKLSDLMSKEWRGQNGDVASELYRRLQA